MLLAFIGGGGKSGNGTSSGPSDYSLEIAARAAGQVEVQERLKAPSSASFDREEVRADAAWTEAKMIGAVHAQNSFGAKIRTRYVCDLARSGDKSRVTAVVFEKP